MKRFYKDVSVAKSENGFQVLLDGRPVKTPAKNTLSLPTQALANSIAAEWAAQGDTVDPVSMPHLKLANAVIDGVSANREEVIGAILRFGENDALCYRAHEPPELARRQHEGWDPMLAWVERRFGARLGTAAGLNHIDQPPEALAALRAAVAAHDDFSLAALHVLASVTGSLVLALALSQGETSAAHAFKMSRLDEDYQAEKWGLDTEAQTRARNLSRELDKAAEFIAHAAVNPAA
jgi:chaperone required for assembly of F1-ATPase